MKRRICETNVAISGRDDGALADGELIAVRLSALEFAALEALCGLRWLLSKVNVRLELEDLKEGLLCLILAASLLRIGFERSEKSSVRSNKKRRASSTSGSESSDDGVVDGGVADNEYDRDLFLEGEMLLTGLRC